MKKKILAIVGAITLVATANAFAGTGWSNYSTTVGAFNGNGYSGTQIKDTMGAAAQLNSWTVGGGYEVDARQQLSSGSGNGDWTRNVSGGYIYYLDGDPAQNGGSTVRVHFSNDLTTTVDVQVTGTWSSN
ncbi:MAG: hypothetical protein KME52_28510 [Desmonostoc geniculatum HA4340-LM1]|nr:hypothetical protein [Desmonostoc geniculatum HA4340-LM1]